MADFLNRDNELKDLEGEHSKSGGRLVLMYGRRRVGKTRLLREFTKRENVVFYTADRENEVVQVSKFTRAVQDYPGGAPIGRFLNWPEMLEYVFGSFTSGGERVVVVLDEFQDIVAKNRAVPSVLRNLWSDMGESSNLMLILCGSLVSEMERLQEGKEPLYGRFTAAIRIRPFSFWEASLFFPGLDFQKKVEMYSVLGGMPMYLGIGARYKSALEVVAKEILSPSSILYEEVPLILSQELRDPANYVSILESIARGFTRSGQIAGAMGMKATTLNRYLSQLEKMDLVKRAVPVTEKSPEKSKKGIYVIQDNFVRFWYRFLYPYKYLIEEGETKKVLDVIRRDFDGYVGTCVEEVVREAVRKANRSGGLPLILGKTGRYWQKGLEIDICGIGEEDGEYLWGECSWSRSKMDVDDLFGLIAKVERTGLNTDGQNHYILVSKSGFTDRLKEKAGEMGVLLWTPVDLESVFVD